MRVLITGAAGFLGHHLVEYVLTHTDAEVVSLDRLDTSGNLNRLTDLECWAREKTRVRVLYHDLRAPISTQLTKQIGSVDVILHLAAMTHVDRSIAEPEGAVLDNVLGTCHLLDYARQLDGLQRVIVMSTDEVFGPSDGYAYREDDRHHAGNPYSAAKSGAEQLGWAYQNTYGLPLLVARSMNLYGPRQHPEKYIPASIVKILAGEEILVHSDSTCTIPGARSYIHASHVADALMFLVEHGAVGEAYHIVGEKEVDNLALVERLSTLLKYPLRFRLVDFHSSRPGHDRLYRLDGSKLAALGWKPPHSFDASLEMTVRWYVDHPQWL